MEIVLESDYVDLANERGAKVEGQVVLSHSERFLEGMLQVRLTGEEIILCDDQRTKVTTILDLSLDTLLYASRRSTFSFSFPLPKDLPASLAHPAASITYTLHATFDSLPTSHEDCSIQRPVYLTRSNLPTTTIMWGTTQEKVWKYEVEVPKIVNLNQKSWITVRLKQLRKRSREAEAMPQSLLVGAQIWEMLTLETPMANDSSITQCIDPLTHVYLKPPSSTWDHPISFPLLVESTRANQDTHSAHIHIKHNLRLTIAFGVTSESDIVLDFPVTLYGSVDAIEQAAMMTLAVRESERMSRRDSGVSVASRDADALEMKHGGGVLYDQAHVCGTLKLSSLKRPAMTRQSSIMSFRDRIAA